MPKTMGATKAPRWRELGNEAQGQISGGNGPSHKGHGLIEIVDGAAVEAHAAQDHGPGVEDEACQEYNIIDMIIAAEAPAPQENGVHRAAPVKDDGQQKTDSRVMPQHSTMLIQPGAGLKFKDQGSNIG